MIYVFIFELHEIKIKLISEGYDEYLEKIRKNKNLRSLIIILVLVLEVLDII
jgi:hypothetical protein